MRLQLRVRLADHPCEALVATTLINGEDEIDVGLVLGLLSGEQPGFHELARGADRGRPHPMLVGDLNRLQILAFHDKEASIFVENGRLVEFALPLVQLMLVPGVVLLEVSRVAVVVLVRGVLVRLVRVLRVTPAIVIPMMMIITAAPTSRLVVLMMLVVVATTATIVRVVLLVMRRVVGWAAAPTSLVPPRRRSLGEVVVLGASARIESRQTLHIKRLDRMVANLTHLIKVL
mmetsp:Transcript_4774/g.6307  ORF Transcript_4774/g.6307 Transcript_4774/m.6307 type:complete len:232 (+) Transcript_4774:423-1118(+)|eukprot:CAMPEP_0185598970 /NCGR_PEP_ID=MMETSP0434-20130131/82366_1 /TAXON_ID=626734 ORGANISM="Favella taraikaensis, Strain Fe Narragansett Bay" /NCGR_SAMPLE_ID=MMETSP0434 /ASSEMBLY_ACC=CAM_ASM_000379 /LENGTH=231 /DNA_ID=CAMNT_0028228163 /DNA_START=361 /DNA_END=1056 /DNA_ORIENTATION=+